LVFDHSRPSSGWGGGVGKPQLGRKSPEPHSGAISASEERLSTRPGEEEGHNPSSRGVAIPAVARRETGIGASGKTNPEATNEDAGKVEKEAKGREFGKTESETTNEAAGIAKMEEEFAQTGSETTNEISGSAKLEEETRLEEAKGANGRSSEAGVPPRAKGVRERYTRTSEPGPKKGQG
jgi:hypothetical protein